MCDHFLIQKSPEIVSNDMGELICWYSPGTHLFSRDQSLHNLMMLHFGVMLFDTQLASFLHIM